MLTSYTSFLALQSSIPLGFSSTPLPRPIFTRICKGIAHPKSEHG
jgi:hypothetical protein